MTNLTNGLRMMILLGFIGLTQSACAVAPGQLDSLARVQKLQQVACSDYDKRGRG